MFIVNGCNLKFIIRTCNVYYVKWNYYWLELILYIFDKRNDRKIIILSQDFISFDSFFSITFGLSARSIMIQIEWKTKQTRNIRQPPLGRK